jgi:hypothetical protein
MDRPPLKGRPYVYRRSTAAAPVQKPAMIPVVFDRGPDRRSQTIPCPVLERRTDDRSRRLATVLAPTGKRLQVVFSEVSRLWRPIRS